MDYQFLLKHSPVLQYSEDIDRKVETLTYLIFNRFSAYKGSDPLLVLPVLSGAYKFAADLLSRLELPVEIRFIRARSYEGMESSGRVSIEGVTPSHIQKRRVLVVEDIVDTGLTMKMIREALLSCRPGSLALCSMFDKPDRRKPGVKVNLDFLGYKIPDRFVIGYGLDFDGLFRNLPDVRYFDDEALAFLTDRGYIGGDRR